jgi:glycosyltransferase involved in cell wall biosynthesis
MNKLSVIIPVYNERERVEEALKRVHESKTGKWKKEIIVVDDGSTDGTQKVLRLWESRVKVIYKEKNEGKGSALSLGFKEASGDVVLIQDADLEYSPDDYPILLKPFDNSHVDVVYGSRFLGAHLSTMFVYELGNKFVTFITNILFNTNITDMETGFKVFRSKVIQGMTIRSRRFDVEPELTVKALKNGYQIYEVPISYYGRKFEEGKKLTWKDGVAAVGTLLWYRFFN